MGGPARQGVFSSGNEERGLVAGRNGGLRASGQGLPPAGLGELAAQEGPVFRLPGEEDEREEGGKEVLGAAVEQGFGPAGKGQQDSDSGKDLAG